MRFLRRREVAKKTILGSLSVAASIVCFLVPDPFHHVAMGFTILKQGYRPTKSRLSSLNPLEDGSQSSLTDFTNNNGGEINSTTLTASSPTLSSTSSSQCPFVKFFPRYRIDLTSRKSKREESSSWFSLPSLLPLKGVSQSLDKNKIERLRQPGENFVWIPKVDGISALAQLWKCANDLLQSTDGQVSLILSLPDASPPLVQNWIEIVSWMASNYPLDDSHSSFLEATVLANSDNGDDGSNLKNTVRLRKRGGDSSEGYNIGDFDEETINRRTQAWVKRILVDQGICPFTKSVKKSGQGLADVGVPVGTIAYHASPAIHPVSLFADTFRAIEAMIEAGPGGKSGVSSILLAAPAFDDDFDLWSGQVFAMLEANVVAAMAEAQIGVVCFHPNYACPDGSSWPGFGHMHSVTRLEKWYKESLVAPASSPTTTAIAVGEIESCPLSKEDIAAGGAWQRRTPHATINILRADQLEAAEAKRSSGSLYPINIDKLVGSTGIGSDRLAQELERERQLL